jgi:hypothetical protein
VLTRVLEPGDFVLAEKRCIEQYSSHMVMWFCSSKDRVILGKGCCHNATDLFHVSILTIARVLIGALAIISSCLWRGWLGFLVSGYRSLGPLSSLRSRKGIAGLKLITLLVAGILGHSAR